MTASLLYLSAADVHAAGVSPDALREAVAAAFAAKARGDAKGEPKLSVAIAPGHFFQAMPGALLSSGLAGMKWVGVVPAGQTTGPTISALIILADLATGAPVAVMDGTWITAARTAAMTAVAAERLARPDSTTIGFIGCGVQARSHLAALRRVLPRLSRMVACSRSEATAERFAAEAREAGLVAETTRDPRRAVEDLDVVVTTVPAAAGLAAFLDPAWLAPGSFAAAVDLGRSWVADGLGRLDLLATDEHEQSRVLGASGKLAHGGPYHADLAGLVTGKEPGRSDPGQRAMFLFAGHSLADLAAAEAVLEAARRRGIGTALPL
jgi:ornithine cyclodeaminase/alanine dehydrogenase-like protein (mu-crystallin family)